MITSMGVTFPAMTSSLEEGFRDGMEVRLELQRFMVAMRTTDTKNNAPFFFLTQRLDNLLDAPSSSLRLHS